MIDLFQFRAVGILRDDDLELLLRQTYPTETSPWGVPAYLFQMLGSTDRASMGRLTLRVGYTESTLRYSGQIGYSVEPDFRGHRLAERACRLVLPLARSHGMSELWITCAPDNFPSRRTIERLGGVFVEEVAVPDDYPLPPGAIRRKMRYRVAL